MKTFSKILSEYNTYACVTYNSTYVCNFYICSWKWWYSFCCFWGEEPKFHTSSNIKSKEMHIDTKFTYTYIHICSSLKDVADFEMHL